MCSIVGVWAPVGFATDEVAERVRARLGLYVVSARERGRDAWGAQVIDASDERNPRRTGVRRTIAADDLPKLRAYSRGMMVHLRAEPTVEVAVTEDSHIQPYTDNLKRWVVAHNGVIANDKELRDEYDIVTACPVDSAVLPGLFLRILDECPGAASRATRLAELFKHKIIGSYAIAAQETCNDYSLTLVTNYRPMAVRYDSRRRLVYYASMPGYLHGNTEHSTTRDNLGPRMRTSSVLEIPPYTVACFKHEGGRVVIETRSIEPAKQDQVNRKKALIVLSGGMDSTVAATQLAREGYDLEFIHFQYGCRASAPEKLAVQNIAEFFDAPLTIVPTDIFTSVVKGSNLTRTKDTPIADGEAGAEFAHEWVPARNFIMLSIATGVAEARRCDVICLGLNLEEAGAYPDNEQMFVERVNRTLPFATSTEHQVRLVTPLAALMKAEIVNLGLSLGAPLHLTWSCYNAYANSDTGKFVACGTCGSCHHRKHSWQTIRVQDPQFEHEWSEEPWASLIPYTCKTWG